MNVLVTSAGRRGSLVKAFGEAVAPSGGRVFASDISALAPALYLADAAFQTPRALAEDYVDVLLAKVEEESIGLVVPTLDTELPVLSAARPRFAEKGCLALVSLPDFVRASGHKGLFHEFCLAQGIDTHRSWTAEEALKAESLPERLFVKPCMGSASIGTHRATRETLREILSRVEEPIVQEEAQGDEITIDALLGLEGETLHYVPRKRIRHLAGESIIGVTLRDDALAEWLEGVLALCGRNGARGPITLQCFLTERGPLLTEINPRFGGGFPLTLEAGGRYPEWCVAMAAGESVLPKIGEYRSGLYMTRYYSEIFFETPLWNP